MLLGRLARRYGLRRLHLRAARRRRAPARRRRRHRLRRLARRRAARAGRRRRRASCRRSRAGRSACGASPASATRPSCAGCACASRTRGRSSPSTGAACPTRTPRARIWRASPRRPRAPASRSTGVARCSRCARRCGSTRARRCASSSRAPAPRAALYAGDDATDLDAFDALDRLVDDGRARRGAARRRPLRRGPGGDRRARRPRGRRPRGLRPRAGRARRAPDALPRLPARLGAAVRRRGDAARGRSSIAGVVRDDDRALLYVALGWWLLAAVAGLWLGRRPVATAEHRRPARGRAQDQRRCPSWSRARSSSTASGRSSCSTVVAGAIGFLIPQVPADRDRLRAADGAAVAPTVAPPSRRSRVATGSSSGSTAARRSARRSCCACRGCARSSPRRAPGCTARARRVSASACAACRAPPRCACSRPCSAVSQARRAVATP